MDDLTLIKGVGKATAKKLAEAGFDSFAKIATADLNGYVALQDAGFSTDQIDGWMKAASGLTSSDENTQGEAAAPQPYPEAQVDDRAGLAADGGAGDPQISLDGAFAALLAETGFATVDDLTDMASVGRSLMAAIGVHAQVGGLLADWAPAEDPAEIVNDLVAMVEAARLGGPTETPSPPPETASATPDGWITVSVTGPKKGRFRIGKRFDRTPRTLTVSPTDVERLTADATLKVELV